MCVAFPGRIASIEGDRAKVDFAGTVADVNVSMVEARVGDYVLVHAGVALQTMDETEAASLTDLFDELKEAAHG